MGSGIQGNALPVFGGCMLHAWVLPSTRSSRVKNVCVAGWRCCGRPDI